MASMFERATRTAIAEIFKKHAQSTKFGHLLTDDAKQDLVDDLYDLLVTSRNLKSAGDRFTAALVNPKLRSGRSW